MTTAVRPVTARPDAADEIPRLAEVLAAAFYADPVIGWLVPEPARRMGIARRGFELYLRRLWFAQGACHTNDELSGTAIWERPGEWRVAVPTQRRLLPAMTAIYGQYLSRVLRRVPGARLPRGDKPPQPGALRTPRVCRGRRVDARPGRTDDVAHVARSRFRADAVERAVVTATLFVVPGSHPSMAGRLMLEHKRIAYIRVDLIPALHKPILRLLGFRDTTVPALKIDGRRVQHTPELSRVLEQMQPDPPLFPADPQRRAAVEAAERWGESVLQPVPRRLSWWALRRTRRTALRSMAEGARLHVPISLAIRTARPIIWTEVKLNNATDAQVRADLASLPGMLAKVDGWVADGVLGGDLATAADYQIATGIRLLLCFEDLRDRADLQALAAYAHRIVPDFPGRIPAVLPPAWLPAVD